MLRKAMKLFLHRHRVQLRLSLREMREAARAMRNAGDGFLTDEPLMKFQDADLNAHALILEVAGSHLALRIVSNAPFRNRIFGDDTHRRDLAHVRRVLRLHGRLTRAICK